YDLEAAQERLDKQRRAANKQAKNAYRGVLSSVGQVNALKAAVRSSESALEASEAGFEVGTRTMVEVLTEQRNLYGAKRNYAKARYDYIVNSLSLKQAAGMLQREDLELVNRWLTAATNPAPDSSRN
ncbi:MAG: channel protein TolC, partial [Methylococcaceae bacterium]|nr:channel protein TolC [Methylococcaceae bacterium]